MTQKLLKLSGIGESRLHLAWLSSAEAQRFVDTLMGQKESPSEFRWGFVY